MNKPKIFFLSTSLHIGGTEKFLLTLAESLKEKYRFSVGFLKENGQIGAHLYEQGLAVRRYSFGELVTQLSNDRPDILHTFLYRANIVGRVAGKFARVRHIVSTQQAIDDWKTLPYVLLDRWTARFCDAIVANSETTKNILAKREKIPEGKIEVVYNGVDTAAFAAGRAKVDIRKDLRIAPDAFVVACIMRLHKEKGADLLPAIAMLAPGALFLVAGDGPERAAIQKAVADQGLGGRFRFLGWRGDIAELLAASDLFILPSREESFPQGILEAMAAGLPVIAADVGGVKELVTNDTNGILLAPGDSAGFARSINTLRSDPALAQSLSKAGRATSEKFTKVRMLEEIDRIYQRLLQ